MKITRYVGPPQFNPAYANLVGALTIVDPGEWISVEVQETEVEDVLATIREHGEWYSRKYETRIVRSVKKAILYVRVKDVFDIRTKHSEL
jgi:hypothetical protein